MALAMRVVSLLPATIAVMIAAASWGAHGGASDEASALLAFKAELAGSGSGMLASWNGTAGVCSWEGVACTSGQVVALSLPSYGFAGALSPAIGNLTFLRTLNLSSNWFQGEVPASIGRLARLQTLDLSYNAFSEYGEGRAVSTLGDVYSLGILLLEMFTGMSPTDDMFKGSLDLHKFAEAALPDRALKVADPAIWLHEEAKGEDPATVRSRSERCLASVVGLGVSCSKQLPRERTAMRDAAAEMRAIRDAFLVQCATETWPAVGTSGLGSTDT